MCFLSGAEVAQLGSWKRLLDLGHSGIPVRPGFQSAVQLGGQSRKLCRAGSFSSTHLRRGL